jgi:hypothetical protein
MYYGIWDGHFYAGSQPSIFERIVSIQKTADFAAYLGSHYVHENKEHWLPANFTLIEGMNSLLPNHYLRTSDMTQIRYYPDRNIESSDLNRAVVSAATMLKQSLEGASLRYKLALPITAGWDSRVLLAASKTIHTDILYYTMQYRDLTLDSPDVKIPILLSKKLGLNHIVIDCTAEPNPSFSDIYKKSNFLAHMDDWGKIAYGLSRQFPPEYVCVKGNCAEIARCYYDKYGIGLRANSISDLLKLERGWKGLPFCHGHISEWLTTARERCDDFQWDLLDLFYWEHRMGRWQSQSQLEWDIVQETFTPYNNRLLIELLLSAPVANRRAPQYRMFKQICQVLWPEVLSFPVNPPDAKETLKNILARLGILGAVKKLTGA